MSSSCPPRAGLARGASGFALTVTLALGCAVLGSCQDDVVTWFPDGLQPLEDNPVPRPRGAARSETIAFDRGRDGYLWVAGRGYVHAAPGTVWAALTTDPELLVAICATTSHAITLDLEPRYEFSALIHYLVDDIARVTWDETWRGATVTGTPESPALALIRYQKTFGSDFITLIEGSIQVKATDDDGTTELEYIEHLDALGGDRDDMQGSMQHRFDGIVARVHGTAGPDCP